MRDNTHANYRRGVMSLVILSLLKRGDMYGYQLVQETERASGGRLTTQEGSLYPVLYRLQEQGLVSDRRELVGKRMTRVYYHLEPAGEEKLRELTADYEAVTAGVFAIIRGEAEAKAELVHQEICLRGQQLSAVLRQNQKAMAGRHPRPSRGLHSPGRRPRRAGGAVRHTAAGGGSLRGRDAYGGAAG